MDYHSLIGPAVVAAVISSVVSGIGIWLSSRTAQAVHRERLSFDREQSERRTNAEIALAETKFALDRQLNDHKRHAELAERTLIAFYEARDVFAFVRSRGIRSGEGTSRTPASPETEAQKKARDTYFVPIERLLGEKELFARIETLRYAVVANFGVNTREPFNTISGVHNEIINTAQVLIELQYDDKYNPREHLSDIQQLRNTLGWGPADRPDRIDQKIEKAVADIEAVCRPILAKTFG
jgi:hypothetical protein